MGPQPRSLPVEVIETEILLRLPALTLLGFRSVCKLWNSIISDPDFVKSHLNCTSPNPSDENLVMLKRLPPAPEDEYSSHIVSVLSSLDLKETIILSDLLTLVPYPTKYFTSLIGSVNGLLCLFLGEVHKFVIWNPILRQAKIIDAPIEESMLLMFHGFGWDAVNNDYKLVVFFFKSSYYVYSCKSNRWTSLTNLSVFPPIDSPVPRVIVKGVPYWTRTTRYEHDEKTKYIQPFKFEVGSNEFRCLPELECVEGCCKDKFLLVDLNECISTLVYNSSDCSVDVYCLDDSCGVWRKMCNVGPISCHVKKLSHCFTYGGQIVFNIEKEVRCYDPKIKKKVSNTVKKVVCYDPKINEIKGVGNTKGELIKCYSYKASLVYLEGMKPLHQQAKVTKRNSDSCEMKRAFREL